jgi:hypothetical protein
LVLADGQEFHLTLSIDDKRLADWIFPAYIHLEFAQIPAWMS